MTCFRPPLIAIRGATFHHTPNGSPIFPSTRFIIPSSARDTPPEKWAVLGPSKSTFLSILKGSLFASPPNARLYPAIGARHKWPQAAIEVVSFGAGTGQGMLKGAMGGDGYVSARYETLREEFDLTLRQWLGEKADPRSVESITKELGLLDLLDQDVMILSNGQSRRARIAQALLRKPELLIVDEPFMGLDPPSKKSLSRFLNRLSTPTDVMKGIESTPVVLGLRAQDPIPSWSTHVVLVENDKLLASGEKDVVVGLAPRFGHKLHLEETCGDDLHNTGVVEKVWASVGSRSSTPTPQAVPKSSSYAFQKDTSITHQPIVEFNNITLSYGANTVFRNLTWTIRRGEKWGLFGPNGSGKTTLTSLITSDHPQAYSLDIRYFGRPRLPEPGQIGMNVWDLQARIGISSPEIHGFFPKHLTLRKCVLSGFADTFTSPPKMDKKQEERASFILESYKDLLDDGCAKKGWNTTFGDADLSTQRLALFLRAVVPVKELVILDEAFSGMRDDVRTRCFQLLTREWGWMDGYQALVVISHASEEVPPGLKQWVRLGERGEEPMFGSFEEEK